MSFLPRLALLAATALVTVPALAQPAKQPQPAPAPSKSAAPAPAPAPAPAQAQPQAAAPAPTPPLAPPTPLSPGSRAVAQSLAEKLNIAGQVQDYLNGVRMELSYALARSNNKAPDAMASVVDELFMPDFVTRRGELASAFIDAWAATFTEDEMKQIAVFYNSPVGDKLIKSMPQITQTQMAFGRDWASHIVNDEVQKNGAKLRARGLKL